MVKCSKCGGEIFWVTGAPSSGNPGNPIAVDTPLITLITRNGRKVEGYKEHKCPKGYERTHEFNPGAGEKPCEKNQ